MTIEEHRTPDRPADLLTWMEIDAGALRSNIRTFRGLLPPGTRLQAVVKSNAYGHGMEIVARAAAEEGVDSFGVHAIEEAERLRAAGIDGHVLVLGFAAAGQARRALRARADVTVYTPETLDAFAAASRETGLPARCHVKVETGTNRQGLQPADLDSFLDRALALPGIEIAGVSTHFANIEDTTDHSYARRQLAQFADASALVRARSPRAVRHCACTAAVLTLPATAFDMARVGIGLYGIWPSRETLASSRTGQGGEVDLRPVLTWKARIAQTKWIEPGEFVGYGCTFRATRRTRLAVIPVGYADGYDRRLSGVGHVLLRGGRAPVLGRICMNLFMVDTTDLPPPAIEETVTLLGAQGGESVSAADIAARCNAIPYEIVARLSPSIPRIPVQGNEAAP